MIEVICILFAGYLLGALIFFFMSMYDGAGWLNSLFSGLIWPMLLLFIISISGK